VIRRDVSILQRLSIGFGLLLLLVAVLFGYVFTVQARSSAVEREVRGDIGPRASRARQIERDVMSVGLAARGVLLSPTPVERSAYGSSVQTLREDIQALRDSPMGADDLARVAAFEPRLESYLEAVDGAIGRARTSAADAADEVAMATSGNAAVAAVRRFVDTQNAEEEAALARLTRARSDVDRALVAVSVLIVIGLVVIGAGTTQSIRRPTRDLLHIAGALEAGDWHPALSWASRSQQDGDLRRPARSEMTQLGRALGAAATALEYRERRLRANAEVSAASGRSLDKREVATETLRAIATHVGAEVGVVYAYDAAEHLLEPVATHAVSGALGAIREGDGVPGEAAAERRTIVLTDIPRGTPLSIAVGYDAAPPQTIVAVPILFHENLLGVMVLASLRQLDEEAVAFLEAVAVQFGIGLQNVRAHETIEQLVAELRQRNQTIQAQNEEIQAQNEEIQAQNEEIQAQAEELQSQNEELQVQNEEIRTQNEQLRERTEQVEESREQLRAQAAMLADADARKDDFLATLGHELRNPMAALTMSLRVFEQSDPGSERAARSRAVMERQVQHLIRLIDDLLDLTRISRGKVVIRREALDLAEVIRTCVDDQRDALEAKALTLEVDLPPVPVWIDGDRTRLCQVVNNLLHNASKFTESRGHVWIRLTTDAAGEAVLHVADDGIGFDQTTVSDLFEPFRQGATTLDRAGAGLGLGLTLVKTFAELHGGSVQARSRGVGKGAEFIIRLPLGAAGAAAHEPAAPAGAATRGRHVLVVEDNTDAAWSLREMLEIQGHQVDVAHTGPDALARARTAVPELVLCDIGLPEMDGYELARRFRADARLRRVPLVAVTGYSSPADESQALAAGFNYHVSKPLDLNLLRQMMAELDMASHT
jgi:signal transduction histidine kinase/ActR/RegA family two-component response regulator